MMKNPDFTAGDLKRVVDYDPETGLFTRKDGKMLSSKNWQGYVIVHVHGYRPRAHRLAWFYVHGEWPEDQIDHINGDKADNRIANLRQANNRQNVQNRPAQANNRLGIRGVSPRDNGTYAAIIWVNGKRRYLGYFKTPEEASQAYTRAASENFGEFCHQSIAADAQQAAA